MKTHVRLSLLLALLWMLPAPSRAQAPPLASPPDPVKAATAWIDLLAKGDYAAAGAREGGPMKSAAPPEKLAEIWTAVQGQLGAYGKRTGTRTEDPGPYVIVYATTEFAKQTVDLKVVVAKTGEIVGFFIVPPGGTSAPGTPATPAAKPDAGPPPYAKPDAYAEREVTVGAGEWALPGTLTVPVAPVGKGPFPAVVLVHGSGPNDRDETVEANKPFRDLAWGLASRGIAVLRYEKRTRQHSDKAKTIASFTVQQETVDDVLAAVALLRSTSGIDPRRVFVLGHSLGGTMVPRIAQRQPGIAGLIVAAGATRPIEDAILEQVTYLAGLDGAVSDEEKKQIEGLRQEVAKVKALKEGDAGPVLGAPASYWLDLRGYDPAAESKYLPQPLLVLQGERDYQVTMADFAAWKKALADRPRTTFKSYPKLDHLFLAGEGKSGPAEYAKPGHVDPAVIEDVASWILAQGPGR